MNFDGQTSYKPIYSHNPYILGLKCYNTSPSTSFPSPINVPFTGIDIGVKFYQKLWRGNDEDFCNDLEKEVAKWEEEIKRIDGLVDQLKKVWTSLRMELICPLTRSEDTSEFLSKWVRMCMMDGNGENHNFLIVCFEPDIIEDYT